MRVLVCGSRDFINAAKLYKTLDDLHAKYNFEVLIEGGAPGADTLASLWAKSQRISCLEFPAEWLKYGRAAGPIRNKQMLEEGKPDLVVAFPRTTLADSKGTKNMVEQALKAGIRVITKQDLHVIDEEL